MVTIDALFLMFAENDLSSLFFIYLVVRCFYYYFDLFGGCFINNHIILVIYKTISRKKIPDN